MEREKRQHNPAVNARRPLGMPHLSILALGTLLSILTICPPAYADERDVLRVEEDWEVVLNEPEADVDAPQFHTVIAPYSHMDSFNFQVCWNYREGYDFAAGGMQLRAWYGDYPVGKKSYREDKLSTAAETVTWTQSIATDGWHLTFSVSNGSSTTWSAFGGTELTLTGPVAMPNFNNYSPNYSVANSWISYGSNRVDLLRIKEVRKYDADGNLISRDPTPRVVFQLPQ